MATNIYGNGTTTASAGANTITHFYDMAGIKAANRVNVYGQWASKKDMPTKMGKKFKISKFLHMYDRAPNDAEFAAKGYMSARTVDSVSAALAASALAEGAGAVNERGLSKITVETDFYRYGEMIKYTDEVDLFSEDDIQVRYREELGELANSRMEDLIQMDMLATPTKLYSGFATSMATLGTGVAANGSTDATYKVSYDLIKRAQRKLVRNRAKKNTEVVYGSTKIDTKTVAPAFYAIIGADVKADLENLTRGTGAEAEYVFKPYHLYGDAGSVLQGEVGQIHETRFIESESAVVYAGAGANIPASYTGTLANDGTKFNVYPILYPTKGTFATVGLKGKGKINFNSKSPSDVSNENPYGTNGFFSYNFFYAGIILEEEKLLRVDVLASV